jgi:predicted RNase H-like nuclease (RuvC/YqgF family)
MLWVLWDIFLPIIAAFLVGLLTGWLLWRWRRSRVDAESLNALRRSAARLKADADNLRIRNAELSDRLQVASGSAAARPEQGAQDLARAKRRIDVLSAELKTSRQQLDKMRRGDAQASGVNRVRELEAKLQGAQRRIADLEKQPAKAGATASDQTDLREAIRVRDEMITTLRTSLDQFGEANDTTTLEANLALRDRKIEALEKLLEESNQRKS